MIGCSHVSPGCEHCYAETLANRYGWTKKPWGAQYAAENVQLRPKRLNEPFKWKQPKRVFVNSLSDVFHEQIPDEYIAAMFGVMAASPQHTFQILTKRPERMLRWFAKVEEWTEQSREVFQSDTSDWRRWQCLVGAAIEQTGSGKLAGACSGPTPWPLPNVWLGVSVEDQRRADERIPLLLRTPSAVRFLSCEPLLGSVDLGSLAYVQLPQRVRSDTFPWDLQPLRIAPAGVHKAHVNPHGAVSAWTATGWLGIKPDEMDWCRKVDWVIVGGESGPHFRPMDLDWARAIRDQCLAANVAFFYKQSSGLRSGMNPTLDGQTWQQFPEEDDRA